ncbi:MAG TPA: cytochrome C, partial [Gammaproteobacteria bacterium]|nr:cytochrome C [Gammaproteobacteria bacterium]
NTLYEENCGECHFAYQPGLLPARSWRALLAPKALEDHFGENAELDETDRRAILDFLVAHAADHASYKRSIKIRRSIPQGETPLRITEVPYIRHKHREIPRRLIQDNERVGSLSNCDACHRQAAQAIYDDDTVRIPGEKRRFFW